MGTAWKYIHVARARFRQTVLLVLAAVLGWTSAAQLLACTPVGVHCPTAPVQSIAVAKVCCGKAVAVAVRKPQLGDKAFVQCRCAEKRSTQQQANLGQNAPHVEMFVSPCFVLIVPDRIPEASVASTYLARICGVARTPIVPPPAFA